MKIVFIVQGEGRGHLTQAISMAQILESNRHTISSVLVGTNSGVSLPDFFTEKFPDAKSFMSPNLIFDKKSNKLRLRKTIRKNLAKAKHYIGSLRFLSYEIERSEPDLIVNFYEGLGGIYSYFYNNRNVPTVAIAHQYLLLNKAFIHPAGSWFHQSLVNLNSKVTTLGAEKKLVLSFTPFSDNFQEQFFTVPPLIRQEVLTSGSTRESDFFLLAYVNQPALANELIEWHSNNNETIIHCFVTELPKQVIHPNLVFHNLNASLFLSYMKRCKGVVSTAGFETICEAMFFGKPVLLIPLKNHYEQRCNALDAVRAGAGITQEDFNLTPFLNFIDNEFTPNTTFVNWASSAKEIMLNEIEVFEPKRHFVTEKNHQFSSQKLSFE
jgi:uncharacterized protein (TIGR00661 family)